MRIGDPCFLRVTKGIIFAFMLQETPVASKEFLLIGPTTPRSILQAVCEKMKIFQHRSGLIVNTESMDQEEFLSWVKAEADNAQYIEDALKSKRRDCLVADVCYMGNHDAATIRTTAQLDDWLVKYELGRLAIANAQGFNVHLWYGKVDQPQRKVLLKWHGMYLSHIDATKTTWVYNRPDALVFDEDEADNLIETRDQCRTTKKVPACSETNPYNVGLTRELFGDIVYLTDNKKGHLSWTNCDMHAKRYANERTAKRALENLPESERDAWSICTFDT